MKRTFHGWALCTFVAGLILSIGAPGLSPDVVAIGQRHRTQRCVRLDSGHYDCPEGDTHSLDIHSERHSQYESLTVGTGDTSKHSQCPELAAIFLRKNGFSSHLTDARLIIAIGFEAIPSGSTLDFNSRAPPLA